MSAAIEPLLGGGNCIVMAVDPYTDCPCGSGEKTKFCCSSDIVHELSRVVRSLEGEQRAAALEQVNRLLARHGHRPALLVLKAEAEMVLGDWAGAARTVEIHAALAPRSPVALAHCAIIESARGNCKAGVESLQGAIEGVGEAVPTAVCNAVRVVARSLLARGHVSAARKHLQLQIALAENEGDGAEAAALLAEIDVSPDIPLLLKEDVQLEDPPDGAAWRGEFDEALDLANRAAWMAACAKLERLAVRAPHEPSIAKALAVLRQWLADAPSAAAAWRRYSTIDGLPLDDAVEAEAHAQLLAPQPDPAEVESLRIIYPITDIEGLMQRLLSDRRASRMPIDPRQWADGDQPPPKAGFLLLDRPLPRTSEGLTPSTAPRVIGHFLVFGKQTDREARLELFATRTEDFSSKTETLAELTKGLVGPADKQEVMGRTSAVREALTRTWCLPEGTPEEQREALVSQQQRAAVLEAWPSLPQGALDGKSPREAAGDPDCRIRLLAVILQLELGFELRRCDVDFQELRRQLGLPLRAAIDPAGVDVSTLPLARLSQLSASKLSNEDLETSYCRAVNSCALGAARSLGLEAVRRGGLDGVLAKSAVCQILAKIAHDSSEALMFNEQGREAAAAEGRSVAACLLQELAIRLERRDVEACRQLVHRIQTNHRNEPGVQQALYGLMARYGLVSHDRAAEPPRRSSPLILPGGRDAGPKASQLWTPNNQTAPMDDDEDKPLIWTPDQG